ncbi:hypothetical protein B0G57_12763 [Trinickia symbiotica]|nr:hypothetical protein B0G57_12763 [Trinickia symbiotica]
MSEANQGAVRQLNHFIDGQSAAGTSGRFNDVYVPHAVVVDPAGGTLHRGGLPQKRFQRGERRQGNR